MLIMQFQFINLTEKEYELIPKFCEWLRDQMYSYLNNKINRKKIQLRIKYLYEVPWIDWKSTKYLDTEMIMNAIYNSFNIIEEDNSLFKIKTNASILIPNSYTPVDRLIRFLDFGDLKFLGIGIFTGLKKNYNSSKLNLLWRLFLNNTEGTMITRVNILTD